MHVFIEFVANLMALVDQGQQEQPSTLKAMVATSENGSCYRLGIESRKSPLSDLHLISFATNSFGG